MILEWKKVLHRIDIRIYIHPKNSNHLRSYLRAIMALDHSRLGLENEFLENKLGRIFCVPQVYLTKSCQQLWVRVNQQFILFIHHIWGETVIWGAVFIIQTSKCSISQFFRTNCTHSIFRTVWRTRGLLAKPFKKLPKSPIQPAGSHFWQAPNFQWTLKEYAST